ncbi:hypothetical protein TrCOL_g10488 [Triparma columacea]|uniref:CAAX prenyl protease 2/Lysostaphin resistance protein A-like domain-containing protein n=1 Tax=Triparma columacea TaxID=722753 RepID=A0A9W7GNS6_9STRA|nr:hypothetical protein TrCOL_g10488 [Triparma columacea]
MTSSSVSKPPLGVPLQVLFLFSAYLVHLLVLTKTSLSFPFQLLPNNHGLFLQIGYDSLAGMICLSFYVRKVLRRSSPPPLPWSIPKSHRPNVVPTLTILLLAYFSSSVYSPLFSSFFKSLDLSPRMIEAGQVLCSHLCWVGVGCKILSSQLPDFFSPSGGWYNFSVRSVNWFKSVLYGYMISCFVFNVVDSLNAVLLPASLFSPEPGLVGRLVSGSTKGDWVAKAIGAIAPCLSAPWWEEVLYRGFLFPSLTLLLRPLPSLLLSSLIFSSHHLSLTSFFPLFALGAVWGLIYKETGNLWVVVAIHGLWNSRVFIGGWAGV